MQFSEPKQLENANTPPHSVHLKNLLFNRPSEQSPPKIKRQIQAVKPACTVLKSDWLKNITFN